MLVAIASASTADRTYVPQCRAGSTLLQVAVRRSVPTVVLQLGVATEEAQGAQTLVEAEAASLGPVAPALSTLEFVLEQPSAFSVAIGGPGGEGERAHQALFVLLCILFVSMLCMTVPFVGLGTEVACVADILGKSIKVGIEKFDRSVLGVDVTIGNLTVNPFDGYIDCEHLIVHNPVGYTSPYLLKAEKVFLDIDMLRLSSSFMNMVSVEKMVFKDITAIYEKKWGTSNMQEVLQFLNEEPKTSSCCGAKPCGAKHCCGAKPCGAKHCCGAKPYGAKEVAEKALPKGAGTEAAERKDVVYELHRVDVQNVNVNVRLAGTIGEYVNLDMEAGDVYYKDFNAEVGHSIIDDVVRELLRSLLKTVITKVAGKSAGNYLM